MRVNELFYSLQGEGRFTGTPAVFIRFSGCNLQCDFCDTEHQSYEELTEEDILREVAKYPASHVVVTGGEPTLQLTASLVDRLHEAHKFVQVETNGTRALTDGLEEKIDWITCSPKYGFIPRLQRIDELKVVFDTDTDYIDNVSRVRITDTACYYLQPCDRKDEERNKAILSAAIQYILNHPQWKLSLQTHKILDMR